MIKRKKNENSLNLVFLMLEILEKNLRTVLAAVS